MRKKSIAVAICTAVTAGLGLTAISAGDTATRAAGTTATYKGTFTDSTARTRVTIKAALRNGKARKVKSLKFKSLAASCTESGDVKTDGAYSFRRLRVNPDTRKFRIKAQTYDADHDITSKLRFKGRFSSNYKSLRGRIAQTLVYGPDTDIPPPETCVGGPSPYRAAR